jgi:hypothetical protein
VNESLTSSLREAAFRLAMLRESIKQRKERIETARRGFEATIALDLELLKADADALDSEEATVRAMALVAYETEGHKRPAPGVDVVVTKDYEIDEASGLQWAKTTKMCLLPEQLDVKAVKKMAAVVPLPFVEVRERPTVRIASDLLAALSKEAA